jgi:hypothetical protein
MGVGWQGLHSTRLLCGSQASAHQDKVAGTIDEMRKWCVSRLLVLEKMRRSTNVIDSLSNDCTRQGVEPATP